MDNNKFMKSSRMVGLLVVGLSQMITPVQANWNNSGCNDWPEWTPMYWMEKMTGNDQDCDVMRSYYQGVNAGYAQSALQQPNTMPMSSSLSRSTYGVPYSALFSGVNGNEVLSQYPASAFRQPVRKLGKQRNAMYGYPMGRSLYGQQFQSFPRWGNGMSANRFGSMGSGFPMMGQGFGSGMPMGGFGSPMSMGSPMSPMGFGSPMSMGMGSPMGMSPMGTGGFGSPMSMGGGRGFNPFSGGRSMPFF